MSNKARKQKKTKSGNSAFVMAMLTLLSIVLIVVFKLGFIFLIVAMLPSIVSYYIDITRNNYTFHSVFACNLAGVLPFFGNLIERGITNAYVQQMMTQTENWLIIYSMAGFGWVLVLVAPIIAQAFIATMHQRQIYRLEKTQQQITAEWGKEIEAFVIQRRSKA